MIDFAYNLCQTKLSGFLSCLGRFATMTDFNAEAITLIWKTRLDCELSHLQLSNRAFKPY